MSSPNLSIEYLRLRYAHGLTPLQLWREIDRRCAQFNADNVWIHRLSYDEIEAYLARLTIADPSQLPLYGIPFAIKDNIDLAGIPTTAACRAFGYIPERSATVVERLIAAGAIPIGKTNLDQFATGLNGTRSPYGIVPNAFNAAYISGGSSSGSAGACARNLVSFALGTDTAGSGRVPAALNNLVGLKPTPGLISTQGVVPACRSLDVVSIFALNTDDARVVFEQAAAFDPHDIFARRGESSRYVRSKFVFGVPSQLEFFGDAHTARLFSTAAHRLQALGGTQIEIDFEPFLAAARLLYEGPYIAERYLTIESLLKTNPTAIDPVVRAIIEPAANLSATEAFKSLYQIRTLKRRTDACLAELDFIFIPTLSGPPTIEALLADPIRLNSRLGHYTNFMNILDYAAISIPIGIGEHDVPVGATLFARAQRDRALLDYATCYAANSNHLISNTEPLRARTDEVLIAVCGAHMSGLPLNSQLTERGCTMISSTSTAPLYRLYALPGGPPARAGLVRVNDHGHSIEIEVWAMPIARVGDFIRLVPSPLSLGSLTLANGNTLLGFLCENAAVNSARDISDFGGWREYMKTLR